MESMPARIAFLMPSLPIAWQAARLPALCASLATCSSSSCCSAVWVGTTPGVSTPPVAIALMKCAPALSSARVAPRTPSGPSASRPMKWPCPPVIVMTRPAARIRGPGTSPSSTARARSIAMPLAAPHSRTEVTPDSSVTCMFR